MAEYTGAVYPSGHMGIMKFGLETGGMLSSVATTLPAAPTTMKCVGYNVTSPTISLPENTQRLRASGTARSLGNVGMRRTPGVSGSVVLSHGANVVEFINYALRYSSTTLIPAVNRYQCMPVFALAGGWSSQCLTASNLLVARYNLMSSLTINAQLDQWATCDYQTAALAVQTGTSTPFSEAEIIAAGGYPLSLQDARFECNNGSGTTTDFAPIVESVSVSIANAVTTRGVRHPTTDSDALSRAPRSLTAGSEDLSFTFSLTDPLPFTPDTSVFRFVSPDGGSVELAIAGIDLESQTYNGAGPEAALTYSANFLASQITATYIAGP